MSNLSEPPAQLFCHICGCERSVPPYWKNMGSKQKQRALIRPCRKCGSGRKKEHGLGQHKIYMVWYNMMARCGHVKVDLVPHAAKNYRDKGITVCPEWHDLPTFAKWAFANGYVDGLWIDRIKNNLNYYPGNCRWVNSTVSGQNRTNLKLDHTKAAIIRLRMKRGSSIEELAAEFEVDRSTINRIRRNESWRV